jgi:antitoxin component YwqK of YwqJK toxin-antitoxin module
MIGTYRDGSKQGIFREYDKDGAIIAGEVYDGNIKVGEGIIDAEGNYQGPWKLFFPTGELRAEGSYVDGKREGDWTFYFKAGKWVWFYENSALWREEYYRKGKEDGPSVEYNREGGVIEQGEFIDGLRTGAWIEQVGDHKQTGSYIDGERTGEWLHSFDNGKTSFVGEYLNGIPIGKHKYYYVNGTLKEEGKYKGGVKEGDWKYYDEEGNLLLTIQFKAGVEFKIDGVKVPQPGADGTASDENGK